MLTKMVEVKENQSVKDLLLLLEGETEIILTEDNQPIARILPVEQPETEAGPRVPGLFPGIWMSDDFDDPLPDEFWLGEDILP